MGVGPGEWGKDIAGVGAEEFVLQVHLGTFNGRTDAGMGTASGCGGAVWAAVGSSATGCTLAGVGSAVWDNTKARASS